MANTFNLIEAKTIVTPSASVIFSSIPTTYTDLKIMYSGKSSDPAAQGTFMLFNGSSSGVSSKYIIGDGANPGTGNLGYMYVGSVFGTGGTSNVFSANDIYIPNAFSTQSKSYVMSNAHESDGVTGYMNVITGRDTATTSNITSITLNAGGGNWIADSTFYLYGISKS
jgi:hypothetical protein